MESHTYEAVLSERANETLNTKDFKHDLSCWKTDSQPNRKYHSEDTRPKS